MITKLIGLDTSTSCSGVSFWVNGKYAGSTAVKSDRNKDRIDDMILKLYQVLDKAQPDIIVIENDAVNNGNTVTIVKLSKVIGAVRGWALAHDAFYWEFNPSTWRSLCGFQKPGLSRARFKALSIQHAKENIVGNKPMGDDEADAVNIGYAYIKMFEKEQKEQNEQKGDN